jgi:hypothetical protein
MKLRVTSATLLLALAMSACEKTVEPFDPGPGDTDTTATGYFPLLDVAPNPLYDSTSGGIYKGVIIGHRLAGDFLVNAQNTDTITKMIVRWRMGDSAMQTVTLYLERFYKNWKPGTGLHADFEFENIELSALLTEWGSIGTGVAYFQGHTVQRTAKKHASKLPARVFLGRFKDEAWGSGIIGLVTQDRWVEAKIWRDDAHEFDWFRSYFMEDTFSVVEDGVSFTGKDAGNTLPLTITLPDGRRFTCQLTRTM